VKLVGIPWPIAGLLTFTFGAQPFPVKFLFIADVDVRLMAIIVGSPWRTHSPIR
jgi:hypothetical protein